LRVNIGKDRNDGRTRKKMQQILDDLKKNRGYRKVELEAITHFGKGRRPIVRQTTERLID
jgi:hypothetical protein